MSIKTMRLAAGALAGLALATLPALGQVPVKYPKDTVILATHSSPGGGSDVFLRELVPHLTRIMGVNFAVENISGGSGAKAMATIAKAKPDGGMFYATTPTFIYTSLLSKPEASYKDLEPLVNVFFDPEVIYTASDGPLKTLGDVIERAKSSRGKWGAANPASLERQVLERMKAVTGVKASVVTFEGGGDMMINVLNHTLDIGVGELQEIRPQLDAGKLRVVAIMGDKRLDHMPDVPTAREQGVDVSVRKFRGLAGPKNTPPAVVAAWESAVQELLADPKYKAIYLENNLQPAYMAHDAYVKFIAQFGQETEDFLKTSGVIK
ncbi:MAG: tripartite tricarboxylate transporter substrate binding protein [Hyphomicrobiales bacterium]|nr:tripartite tricarboxylate transporter substrate binding protein [Hyphomicrobiales bacterium]